MHCAMAASRLFAAKLLVGVILPLRVDIGPPACHASQAQPCTRKLTPQSSLAFSRTDGVGVAGR